MEIVDPYEALVVDDLAVVALDGYDVIVFLVVGIVVALQTHSHVSVAVVIVVEVDVDAVVAEVESNNEIIISYDLLSTDYIYTFFRIGTFDIKIYRL